MARAPLVTVPDEGAAWLVRDALADGGVTAEVERAGPEHPYMTSVLAHPMRIFVPAEQLEQARLLLAGLEAELASHPEELAAQALAAGQPGSDTAAAAPPARLPRLSWALALGFLLPIPVVCFYGRAWRMGALFAGLFVAGLIAAPPRYLRVIGFSTPLHHSVPDYLAPAAKLADLAIGLPVVVGRRRRAKRAPSNAA